MLRRELCTRTPPLYVKSPKFRNLFMKILTRDRVVPIISARTAWLILGMIASDFPSFPKWAIERSTRDNRFSEELKS